MMKPIAIVMSLGLVLLTMRVLPTHRAGNYQAVIADDDGDDDDGDADDEQSTLAIRTLPALADHCRAVHK